MKTSDALREADARGLPDLRENFINPTLADWEGEKPPCCALGGVAVVSGAFVFEESEYELGFLSESSEESAYNANTEDWKALDVALVSCAVEECSYTPPKVSALTVVIHLYDEHKWSRTRIADWLNTIAMAGK